MKKPSEITSINLVWTWLLPIGCLAMTFFGKMLIKRKDKKNWEYYEKSGMSDIVFNHEMMHVKQAVSTNDSWWKFYLLYIWYWLKANPLFNGFTFVYKMNPFELEAYSNERDLFYNGVHSSGATRWKVYKTLTIKKRKAYWKDFEVKKKTESLTFCNYIQKYIDPELDFKDYT